MKFSEALASEEAAHRKGPPCSLGALLTEMDAEDVAALQAALASQRPHTWIARALGSIGHKVLPDTVKRHRRGECQCDG